MNKKYKYFLEAILLYIVKFIILLLPINIASNIGSFLAKKIGKLLKVNKLAKKNIKIAFPKLDDDEISELTENMWDNLGRTAFEFFHIKNIDIDEICEVEGLENLNNTDKKRIFFSAHIANWEILPKVASVKGFPLTLVYRKANNPYAEKLINKTRETYKTQLIPKGKDGAKKILKAMKKGDDVAMLVDQKMNDGISVPFFGQDAMTPSAIASLAKKYNRELIPVQIIRKKGTKFKLKVLQIGRAHV